MSKTRTATLRAAACVTFIGLATAANAQTVGGTASSAAYGIGASFTGGGMSTSLGPIAPVSGSAPPAYSKTKVVTAYTGSVAIPPLVPGPVIYPIVASLTVNASMLTSHVASPGIGVDDISSSGSSAIGAVTYRIANSQPAPAPTNPEFLMVVASGVQASAGYSRVFPSTASVTGDASFGSLSIRGGLIGGATITYSGDAPANTVLYSSPTVTITAHQQIIAAEVSCGEICTVLPSSITVHALDVSFNNAVVDGRSFSGDITLGDASAGQ